MDDNLKLQCAQTLSGADMAVVKAKVVEMRSEKDERTAEEIAAALKNLFPGVDKKTIEYLESSGGYIQSVIDTQMGKIAAAIPDIIDGLVTKAKAGNVQVVDKLMQLAGLQNVVRQISPSVTNNTVNLKVVDDDGLIKEFHKRAAEVVIDGEYTEKP